jgi:hypothetical protein
MVTVCPLAKVVMPVPPVIDRVWLASPIDPVPDEPEIFKVVATDAEVNAVTRPYISVVTTGIVVELPTVVAPGPTGVNEMVLPEIVKLPVETDVLVTTSILFS